MPFVLIPPPRFSRLTSVLLSPYSVCYFMMATNEKHTKKNLHIFASKLSIYIFGLRHAKDLAWPTTSCKSVGVCITGSQDPQVQRCVTYSTRQKVRFSVILLHAARS